MNKHLGKTITIRMTVGEASALRLAASETTGKPDTMEWLFADRIERQRAYTGLGKLDDAIKRGGG